MATRGTFWASRQNVTRTVAVFLQTSQFSLTVNFQHLAGFVVVGMALFISEIAAVARAFDLVRRDLLQFFNWAAPVAVVVKIAAVGVTGAKRHANHGDAAAGGLAGAVGAVAGVAEAG